MGERADRIKDLAIEVLDAKDIRDDWVEAVAFAIDAYEAGVRPTDGRRARALVEHNSILWNKIHNRVALLAVFDHLVGQGAEFVGAPI